MLHFPEATDRVRNARFALLEREPYLGSPALRLELVPLTELPTYATDGERLYFNPKLALAETWQEVITEIAHELGHIMLMHLTRRGARDPDVWNAAGDYVINDLLVLSGFTPLKDWLHDVKYRGMTTDQVYDLLLKPDEKDPRKLERACSKCCKGLKEPKGAGKGGTLTGDVKILDEKIENMIAGAMSMAKMVGKFPGHFAEAATPILYKPVPWTDVVREFAEQLTRSDYTWKKPNRNYIQQGLYAPSIGGTEKGPFVVGVDTSGSMSNDALNKAVGMVSDILAEVRPPMITLIQCDRMVQDVQEFAPEDLPLPRITMKGRGGTLLKHVFEYIEKHDLQPSGVLFMTDLQIGADDYPAFEPNYPIVWCLFERGSWTRPPIGTVVKVN